MAVKTGHSKDQSLRERGDIADLVASALVLIRGNKRSETQRKHLRRALQLFQENRLAGVIAGGTEVSGEKLLELLSLEVGQLLPSKSMPYFNDHGVKYVGELYLLPYTEWHSWRALNTKSVQACREMLGELGLPFELDLRITDWTPPYANDPKVLELWASPRHILRGRICHGGCGSIGELLRNPRRAHAYWEALRALGLRECMYVPPSWNPPPHNPEVCHNFGHTLWDGERMEDSIVEKLASRGFKTFLDLTSVSGHELREIVGGTSVADVLRAMRKRGLSLRVLPGEEAHAIALDAAEFMIRTYSCLKNEGVTTVGQLIQFTEIDLLRLPNFGRKSLNEVKDYLATLGLSLKIRD